MSLMVIVGFVRCAPLGQTPSTIKCGPGYIYNQQSSACVPEDTFCETPCDADYKCVNKECVPRLQPDPNNDVSCAVTCGDNEICQNGVCVPAPCNPPCQAGFTCSNGVCSPTSECNPPCQQTGYVCVNGLCERICPKDCPTGTQCIRGVCQTPCSPACGNNQFCNDGKCTVIEDNDNDKYQSDRDCDDKDPDTNPGAVEVCNKKDNDCDGLVDNIVPKDCYDGAPGTLGKGPCVAGKTACKDGKLECQGEVQPAAQEDCNNQIDDDCNGQINDGCP